MIVILVPAPHFRGNNRIIDSCVTRNDPRKENRKFYPLLYFVIIRFSFSGIRAWLRNLESDCFVTALCFNLIKHIE